MVVKNTKTSLLDAELRLLTCHGAQDWKVNLTLNITTRRRLQMILKQPSIRSFAPASLLAILTACGAQTEPLAFGWPACAAK